MKVTVNTVFKDKYTGTFYSVGDVIDVDKKRYEEIKTVVDVVNDKKAGLEKKTTKGQTKKTKSK